MLSKLSTKILLHKTGLNNASLSSLHKNPEGSSAFSVPAITNPFATITVPTSWAAWSTPPPAPVDVKPAPRIGSRAPAGRLLRLPIGKDRRPVVVSFLRCCGCPFAEKTFLSLRTLANRHPNIHFIAISHSSPSATQKWVNALGGSWSVTIIVDEERELYAMWGLGISDAWHVLNPWSQMNQWQLGKKEGLWGRTVADGGSKWQIAGTWAVDGRGTVVWGGPANSADDVPNLDEAVAILGL